MTSQISPIRQIAGAVLRMSPLQVRYTQGDIRPDALLTILVAAYNHAPYIAECLTAINAAAGRDKLVLVVIDDGSTDGTVEIARTFAYECDLTVRVYDKANAGLIDTLRQGLGLATTPYVGMIASDDHYVPGAIDAVMERLEAAPAGDKCWVFQATYLDMRDGEPVYGEHMSRILTADPAERLRGLSIEYPKPLLIQSTIFSAKALREAGAWSGELELDDWPTFVRMAEAALTGRLDFRFFSSLVLTRYRLHAGGIHNNFDRQLRACLEVAQHAVPERYRREAVSRVYSDLGLVSLYNGDMARAAGMFGRAIRAKPSPETMVRPIARIVKAAVSRATTKITKGA